MRGAGRDACSTLIDALEEDDDVQTVSGAITAFQTRLLEKLNAELDDFPP